HAGGELARPLGDDLQVLRGVGVDHGQAVVEVADQDGARLAAAKRLGDALPVPGGGDLGDQLGVDGVGELGRGGHQHGGGHHVVLGLADEVGGDEPRVGRVVGEDGDLGGAGLGVDADDAAQQTLGGG